MRARSRRRAGCRAGRATSRALVTTLVLGLGSRPGLGWTPLDAESLARGGIDGLERIDVAPGACLEPGASLACSFEQPYAGSDLVGAAVLVRGSTPRHAAALGLSQLRSPVHRETRGVAALQAGRGEWCMGAAAAAHALTFEGYGTRWHAELRLGAGRRWGGRGRATTWCVLRPGGTQPVLAAALALPLLPHLDVDLQQEREPGAASRTLVGLVWVHPEVHLLVGYDLGTAAASAGCAWVWGLRRLAWGARSHPELGWSQTWSLELGR